MRFCPRCGGINPPNARYCSLCGSSFDSNQQDDMVVPVSIKANDWRDGGRQLNLLQIPDRPFAAVIKFAGGAGPGWVWENSPPEAVGLFPLEAGRELQYRPGGSLSGTTIRFQIFQANAESFSFVASAAPEKGMRYVTETQTVRPGEAVKFAWSEWMDSSVTLRLGYFRSARALRQYLEMQEIGDALGSRYRLLTEISRDGTAVSYLALEERRNKTWAVRAYDKASASEQIMEYLRKITALLDQLDHPNLLHLEAAMENEDYLIHVLSYVEGDTLEQLLRKQGPQPEETVLEWCLQICSALQYLHSMTPTLVYGCLKPSNLMLRPDGTLVLFGLDLIRGAGETVSIGYASPEMMTGEHIDPRSDIYSLGATLYRLATGQDPSEPPYEIRSVREFNPRLSESLEAVILKCTQRDPAKRYQTVEEVLRALDYRFNPGPDYRPLPRYRIVSRAIVTARAKKALRERKRENDT